MTATPATEHRARVILTWGAGDCGLISERACDYLADMIIGREISDLDLYRIARPPIYSAVMTRAARLESLRFLQRIRDEATDAEGAARGRRGNPLMRHGHGWPF